jgi:hypothetical protein
MIIRFILLVCFDTDGYKRLSGLVVDTGRESTRAKKTLRTIKIKQAYKKMVLYRIQISCQYMIQVQKENYMNKRSKHTTNFFLTESKLCVPFRILIVDLLEVWSHREGGGVRRPLQRRISARWSSFGDGASGRDQGRTTINEQGIVASGTGHRSARNRASERIGSCGIGKNRIRQIDAKTGLRRKTRIRRIELIRLRDL